MALKIIDEEIVGKIDNFEDKLEGKLPVDRLELLYLINELSEVKEKMNEYTKEKEVLEKTFNDR